MNNCVETPLGHTISVNSNVSNEEWDDAAEFSRMHGGKTLDAFNNEANMILRDGTNPKIDLSLHIAGSCMTLEEGGEYYFHAVLCCLVGVIERGARFTQKQSGSISFRIEAEDWDLGVATAFLHPTITECGVFSVLVSFDKHS